MAMEDHEKKLLFRLQHIVPQDLSTRPPLHLESGLSKDENPNTTPANDDHYNWKEIEFQMPWGKVAGK